MCGINGFYSKTSLTFDNAIVRMNSAISHRGPDNNDFWIDKKSGIVLGHQRLSIIDLSAAGSQPMKSISDRFVLTYNGEIYNHLQIRAKLQKPGNNIRWKGTSDTETLLAAIENWGIEITLQEIEGMFAFALWDKKERCLTLVRDRIGEKPLYYGFQNKQGNKVFMFSSELKALKAHPIFEGEIDKNVINLQLRHSCIPAPYSIYKNIYKLLPGNYLTIKDIDLKKGLIPVSRNYWSLKEIAVNGNVNPIKLSEKEVQNGLEYNLKNSIKKQILSDVPIGAFLSGGIDSSIVVALMQSQSNYPIKTFTIGFEDDNYSEAKYAKKISKHIGTDHTELYISPKKALDIIPKLPLIYDEPFSDSSQIPTFLVSELAKKQVKVALSGDGGDELFCGYNRHLIINKFENIINYMPLDLRKIISFLLKTISPKNWTKISKILPGLNRHVNLGDKIYKVANIISANSSHEIYQRLCSHWQNPSEIVKNSEEPKTLLSEFKNNLKELNSQQQMMVMDFLTYLPDDILVKIDRAAMSTSLETRAPFLDHKLIEYVWKIPHHLKFRNNKGKWILRKILNKYIPKDLTERPKMGFAIPIDYWLRGELKDWAESLLNEKNLEQQGYFNSKLIRKKWTEHLSGKKNWQSDLWDILMFQAWLNVND
ncbi:asparagine synthase (glutamine-hydrolyzing) [Candidatus Pelagibacter sp.]|nr:asparagine synthase (glutamine-hydrolyzing) [Candidatus Pelagibacter sp.]|tara:strand:+ start:58 stop:2013 length:1956 start_codon:yes stop_codon:yes gene_type:complete